MLKTLAWVAVTVLAAVALVAHGATGSPGPSGAASSRPLSSVLGPGGVLRAARGSFDARGYRLVLARDGAPRFVRAGAAATGAAGAFAALAAGSAQAATGDSWWSDRLGNVGIAGGGTVYAVAVAGSNIYVGGQFSSLGSDSGIAANDVAMWNGHGWFPLGGGIGTGAGSGQTVRALAVVGGKLYAGGSFTTAGGVTVNNLAMWNGSAWADVGGGVTAAGSCCANTPLAVNALAVSGSTLYVGGVFGDVGPAGATIAAHSIAAWNTTTSSWSTLGSGIQYCFWSSGNCNSPSTGAVYSLLLSGSTLYAGGYFTAAGGTEIESLAAWDGANWSAVGGNGLRLGASNIGTVNALAIDNSTTPATLYIGGQFDHAGATVVNGTVTNSGTAAAGLAEYHGTWGQVGGGLSSCCGPTVKALAFWNGRLFAAGSFDSAGGDGTANFGQFTTATATWSGVGPNLNGTPTALLASAGVLAVGGFSMTGDNAVLLNRVGKWTGTAWTGYGLGISDDTSGGSVNGLASSGRTLFAVGGWTNAGWSRLNGQGIARFDNTSWNSLGGGLTGSATGPSAVALDGKYVFVGGQFSSAGGVSASNIAVWDGSQWHALGSGISGSVATLLVYQGKLWVGGTFSSAGGTPAYNIATWNLANLATANYTDSGWSTVGGDPQYSQAPGSGGVDALAPYTASSTSHYVIIGGVFQNLWDALGDSTSAVNGLVSYHVENTDTSSYTAGYTYFAGANGTAGVTGGYGAVKALMVDGKNLYVGGNFTQAGANAATGFAQCYLPAQSTNCWQSSPGTFTSPNSNPASINSIVKVESAYYLAGLFSSAGGVAASNIVQYTPSTGAFAALGSGISIASGYSGSCVACVAADALAEGPAGLYVGGTIGLAGGKPSENIGLWTGTAMPTMTETASAPTDPVGSPVTFTSTITNSSAITWSGLTLTETLPSGVQYDSSSISTTGGSCTATTTTPVKLTCSVGTLNSSASGVAPSSATVAITVTPSAAGKLTNAVTLGASGSNATNAASASVMVG